MTRKINERLKCEIAKCSKSKHIITCSTPPCHTVNTTGKTHTHMQMKVNKSKPTIKCSKSSRGEGRQQERQSPALLVLPRGCSAHYTPRKQKCYVDEKLNFDRYHCWGRKCLYLGLTVPLEEKAMFHELKGFVHPAPQQLMKHSTNVPFTRSGAYFN